MIEEAARLQRPTACGREVSGERRTSRWTRDVSSSSRWTQASCGVSTWNSGGGFAPLERAKGKFKMVILGHPFFAAGRYQGKDDEPFATLHQLLNEHAVDVVMAGDTHDFEFYKEVEQVRSQNRPMYHFVNGGGGAYLSIVPHSTGRSKPLQRIQPSTRAPTRCSPSWTARRRGGNGLYGGG